MQFDVCRMLSNMYVCIDPISAPKKSAVVPAVVPPLPLPKVKVIVMKAMKAMQVMMKEKTLKLILEVKVILTVMKKETLQRPVTLKDQEMKEQTKREDGPRRNNRPKRNSPKRNSPRRKQQEGKSVYKRNQQKKVENFRRHPTMKLKKNLLRYGMTLKH